MSIFNDKLFSNRLLLRKVVQEDLPLLVHWSHLDDSYGKYLTPEYFDLLQMQQKLEAGVYWNEGEKLFLIELRDGTSIGTIHYWCPVGKMGTVTISVKIVNPELRNMGYGTEAQKVLLMYLFDKMGVQQVEMYTDVDNIAQQRCLKKLGFQLVESLTYDDQNIKRTGSLYCLDSETYSKQPIYLYHYE